MFNLMNETISGFPLGLENDVEFSEKNRNMTILRFPTDEDLYSKFLSL